MLLEIYKFNSTNSIQFNSITNPSFPHHVNTFVKSRPQAFAHSSGLAARVPAHSCGLVAGVHFITLVKFCIEICEMYKLQLNTNRFLKKNFTFILKHAITQFQFPVLIILFGNHEILS